MKFNFTKTNWKSTFAGTLISLLLIMGLGNNAEAHCEIPCGIYDDETRIDLLYEHIRTMEKGMNQINELSKEGDKNYNQLVRWIINKDEHARKFQDIVSQYFLHQRIKIKDPSNKKEHARYMKQLELAHHLLIYSMKAKQTTDLKFIEKMRETLGKFEKAYFGPDAHRHKDDGSHKHE